MQVPASGHAVFEDAAVHHDLDACGLGLRRGFLVDYALLQPEIGNLQPDDVVHYLRYE